MPSPSDLPSGYELQQRTNSSTRQSIAVSGLGDESLPGPRIPFDVGSAGETELYVDFWRRDNVIGFLGSSNVLDDFSVRSTLELAKQIDARIAK